MSPGERRSAAPDLAAGAVADGDAVVADVAAPTVAEPEGDTRAQPHGDTPTPAPTNGDTEHTTGPIELMIVPATVDPPTGPTTVVAPHDDGGGREPDDWVEMGDDQLVQVPAGVTTALRPASRRPRVRKVTRVLRHIDPWSTFKVALIFSIVLYFVLLTAGVLLWNVALTTGTVDNIERWFTQFGWETFELKGGEIYHNAWTAGIFGIIGLTGFGVLLATLFNLVSDIVGGVRMTVLEEEVVERTVTSSRRFVVHRAPTDPTWSADDTVPPP